MEGSERTTCVRNNERAKKIAKLNDQLRQQHLGGMIMITRGVRRLPDFCLQTLLEELAAFDLFDEDNDPYGEHDFGDVVLAGVDLLWKIDYYDKSLMHASSDAADSAVTKRILTVMLPEEW